MIEFPYLLKLVKNILKYSLVSLVKAGLFLMLSGWSTALLAQVDTEFWFVVPELSHRGNTGGTPGTLRIATLELDATVTIEMPANPAFTPIVLNIPANDEAAVDLTYLIDYLPGNAGVTGLENKPLTPDGINPFGLHITSSNMINVYWEVNYIYGAEVWTLKGSNGLGTLFYTPFQTEYANHFTAMPSYSAIDVVAPQDNTTITFTLPDGVGASYGEPMNTIAATTPGSTFSVNLDRGETFSLFPYLKSTSVNDKLAGTRITSNNPIAVVLKDDNLNTASQGRSTIGDQIVPVDVTGDTYVVPAMGNPNLTFIVATQDNTNIYINAPGAPPTLLATLMAGEQLRYQLPNNTIMVISSKNGMAAPPGPPFYVFHIARNGMTRAAALLPPIGCTGNTQLAFTRAREAVREDFFFFLITEDENVDEFMIDGAPADPTIIPNDPSRWTRLGNGWSAYKTGNIPASKLAIGQHLVENNGGIFHLGIINGFTSANNGDLLYGYFSDYGGLNVGAVVAGTNSSVIRACYGTPVQLHAYGGTQYEWTPHDYLDDPYSNLPIAVNLPAGAHQYIAHVSGACGSGDVPITVMVAPPVTASFETNVVSGCSPLEVVFEDQSEGNVTWQYDLGDGTPLILYDSLAATPTIGPPPDPFVFSHTYVNNTDSVLSFEVVLMVKNSSACADIITRTINVFPEIHSDFDVAPDIACDPLESWFTNNSSGDTAYWFWDFGDGGSSTEFEPVHEYRNLFGPDNLQFDASLVAISPYNCRDTSWHRVTVRPYIEAIFAYDTVAECSPHEIIITDQSIGADSYLWDFGDGTTSNSAGPVLRHTYTNTTTSPVTYTITLRVDNEEGCTHQIQREVTVYPGVIADFAPTPLDACSPSEIFFQNNTTGPATSYLWDFGDGGSSTEEHPIHYYDRNLLRHDTVFTVMLVATTNEFCRDTAWFDVTLHPYIEAAFTVDDVVGCTPFDVEIHNESIGVDDYYWDFGDGSPVSNDTSSIIYHTYLNADAATVVFPLRLIVTNEEGCSDTMTRNITVHPEITASFSTDGLVGCHPLTINFQDLSLNAVNYLWDFGDGAASTEPSPVHTFSNFGTTDSVVYLVTLTTSTADGECVESISWPVTVYPQVVAEFTFPYAQGCGPFEVTFENLSIGGTRFIWDFGDGTVVDTATADPQTHVFVNTLGTTDPQDYEVSLIAENSFGCSYEVRKTVTVLPSIVAGFDASDTAGCHPLEVQFTNRTTGGQTYIWEFGDGTSTNLENPAHTFTNTGTVDSIYTVKLYTLAPNNTCDDSIFMDVRVHPYVQANFTLPVSLECNPFDAEIINTSVNADTFYWDFGDGSSAVTYNMDPVYHQFTNDGNWTGQQNYEIILVAENYAGCTDEIRRTVTVEPDILADFSASDTVGCHPLTVDFSNLSMGAAYSHWDFGDGTTSPDLNPSRTFTNTGTIDSTYRVWLYTTGPNNVCRDSMYVDIRVHPYVQADFTLPVSLSCNPFDVEIFNASVNADTFYWDFGDGTTAITYNMDPVYHQYTNDGNWTGQQVYEITLVAENYAGCTDEIRRTVTVEPDIMADFSASDTMGCHPLTIDFTNLSQGAAYSHWDFGNGTTSQELSPTQTFTNIGSTDSTYRVWLYTTASNNVCRDSFYVDIVVHPYILAEFTFQEQVNCTPSEVEFHNASIGGDVFYWDFGDGTRDTTFNTDPVYHIFNNGSFTANGVYNVTLRAENYAGCTDQITRVVEVYPAIEAVIDPDVLAGCHPLTVHFGNLSRGGFTYTWDFGDGASSEADSPVHTFTNFTGAPITRTVHLHARSQFNCTSDTTVDITIYPKPVARFETERIIDCAPFEVPLTNTSIYGDLFTWSFGSDTTFTLGSMAGVSHTFDNQTADIATYQITLVAETSFGCLDTVQQNVYVYPRTIADFTINDGDCSPHMAYFVNESVRGQTYLWDFGDGTGTSTKDPSNLYFNFSGQDTTYYVFLTSTSMYGCVDTRLDSIEVYAQPDVEFLATPTHQWYPDATVDFSNLSNQGYWTYHWDLGDGSTSSLENPPAHTYDTWGDYVIWLRASTPHCSDSVSHTIRIFPAEPVAAFDTVIGACEPYTVQFTNRSIYGNSYLWEFDDGTTSTEFEPVHTFQEAGFYNVKLTVTGDGGIDYAYHVVEVYRMPVVNFRVEPELAMLPDDEVRFYNLSEHGDFYLWDFGDGNTSNEENPRHLYTEVGEYDVSLEVTTIHGCVDQATKTSAVTVEAEGYILFPNAFKPDMHGPNGGYYDLREQEKNNIFHPYWEGVAEYNLEIYTRWGEKLFTSTDVNQGWDGYYQENLCKQDVYVYHCWGVFINGELFRLKGDVTLLHHDKLQ